MHIWSALAAREASLLTLLLLLGAGPASFLSERFDAVGRIALAPVLGFCVGTCVTTTLLEFEPAGNTYWLLIPLALGSVGVAAWRTLRSRARDRADPLPSWRGVGGLLIVCVAVTGPLNYALHSHHTVGPAAYTDTDVDNYVALQDAAQTTSLSAARRALEQHNRSGTPWADRTQWRWAGIVAFNSNLDATPLDANVNALLGLGASDTFAPFLIVLLLAGGWSAFAAVRYLTGSGTWSAALAGSLFGGAFFLELWFDSYQAAIVAIGLVVAVPIIGWEVLRARRRADIALLALILATLLTVYPLWVPLLIAAGTVVVVWRAVALRRAGRALGAEFRAVAPTIVALAVLTIVFDLVGFTRDVHYWEAVLENKIALPRVDYRLPPDVLPGWIAQTREFWFMPPLGSGGFKQLVLGALVPLVFLGLIAVGLRRYQRALALVVLACICAIAAYYAYASRNACTYCAERNLLPLAPIVGVLTALGLSALLVLPARWARVVGVASVLLLVGAVGQRARVELERFIAGSYFVDSADRIALSHLPHGGGGVLVEGYDASILSQAEQPLVYHLVNERARGRVSISLSANYNNGSAYLIDQVQPPPGPSLRPDYRYVLTRLGGVSSDRQVIARSGGIALERRTRALDVTPYDGLGVQLEWYDHSGVGWVQPELPLRLFIMGSDGGRPAWARLTLAVREPVAVPRQPGVRARLVGTRMTICVRATGAEPIRQATLFLSAPPASGPSLPLYARTGPYEGIALTAMYAVSGHCSV